MADQQQFSRLRLLIVEPATELADMLAANNERYPVETCAVQSGLKALESLVTSSMDNAYHAVLVHASVPGIDVLLQSRGLLTSASDMRWIVYSPQLNDVDNSIRDFFDQAISGPLSPGLLHSFLLKTCTGLEIACIQGENAPEVTASDVLDVAKLKVLRDMMGNKFILLIETFEANANDKLQQLRSLHHNGDYDELKRVTHGFKGISGNICAMRLRDMCQELEDMIAKGQHALIEPQIEKLAVEFGYVISFLRSERFLKEGEF